MSCGPLKTALTPSAGRRPVHSLALDLDGERRDALAGRDHAPLVRPPPPDGYVVLGGQGLDQGAAESEPISSSGEQPR